MSNACATATAGISIHVPREGHDTNMSLREFLQKIFQSTCPARGTTQAPLSLACGCLDFNPRAPRGARPAQYYNISGRIGDFNPRAPRGARHLDIRLNMPGLQFQSTCPARGTTSRMAHGDYALTISIHVPREGHDVQVFDGNIANATFQSTCPARGTTKIMLNICPGFSISIHVPREGHDLELSRAI